MVPVSFLREQDCGMRFTGAEAEAEAETEAGMYLGIFRLFRMAKGVICDCWRGENIYDFYTYSGFVDDCDPV
jgi:hypothetical protein